MPNVYNQIHHLVMIIIMVNKNKYASVQASNVVYIYITMLLLFRNTIITYKISLQKKQKRNKQTKWTWSDKLKLMK